MTMRVVTMWYRRLDCKRVSSPYGGEENSLTHDRDRPGHSGKDSGGDDHDHEDDPVMVLACCVPCSPPLDGCDGSQVAWWRSSAAVDG